MSTSNNPSPEGQELSGTLIDTVRGIQRGFGALSSTFGLLGVLAAIVGLVLLGLVTELRIVGYAVLGLGVLLLGMALITARQTVVESVGGRRGRYSANTMLMSVVFIAIVAILNFVFFDNPTRMDVTSTKLFTLAPRTDNVLDNLDQPVKAIVFLDANDEAQGEPLDTIDNMLHEFDVRSDKFSYEIVDPQAEPTTARQYGITAYGQVAFVGEETGIVQIAIGALGRVVDQVGTLEFQTNRFLEQDFVTPLLAVTGVEVKSVYFLVGHGERNVTSPEIAEGYTTAATALAGENYVVNTLDLQTQKLVPKSTGEEVGDKASDEVSPSVIVIAGPTKDLLPEEADRLQDYMVLGGRMLLLVDPETPETFRRYLNTWGIELGQGNIVEEEDYLRPDKRIPFITNHNPNLELSHGLERTFFPGLAPITPIQDIPMVDVRGQQVNRLLPQVLSITSPNSWLVEDDDRSEPDKENDIRGPFFTGARVQGLAPIGRDIPDEPPPGGFPIVAVIGDSDFATNEHFTTASNGDLFLNAVNDLAGDVALINIRPKLAPRRELLATPGEFDVIRYTSWFMIPVILALGGTFVWWKQR